MDAGEPAPPPNPELLNRQPKWFKPVFFGCIVVSVLFVLAGLTTPVVIRSAKKSEQTEAISNLRQIGFALSEFDMEYGSFPNEGTAALVQKKHPSKINLSGTSSNALFRQLFAADITHSEQMFYAEVNGAKRPDGNYSPDNVLAKGEVAFAYVSGISTKGNPSRIIAFAPVIPGTTRFDPTPFDGMAVALRIDNSVRSFGIEDDGHIYDQGINLLSPKHPVWKGKSPDIRYPE